MDEARLGHQRGVSPRSSAHRNPSITPTSGIQRVQQSPPCGTLCVLNPTGEMYTPN